MQRWAEGITDIREAELGASPAAVNRTTGVMYINPRFKLSEDQWYFIMLHELGHLKLQTKNELEADRYAHEQYMKEGRSLKQSVYALTDVLSGTKSEDTQRVIAQLNRAQKKDGNVSSYTGHQNTQHMSFSTSQRIYNPNYAEYFGYAPIDDGHEYFLKKLGNWVKDKALPAVGKVVGTVAAIAAGGGGAQAAQPGQVVVQGGTSSTDLAAIFAQQEASRQREEAARRAESEESRKTTMMIAGIGAAVITVIVIVIFAFKK